MISTEDLLWYIDEALTAMAGIVGDLGDERANTAPELPGANTPYAILTHCLGVAEFWGGQVIAGRTIQRDRDAEFTARGPVAELLERTAAAQVQLRADVADIEGLAPPRGPVDDEDRLIPEGRTQGGALVHILEEFAQHRGQLEITRDLLLLG